MARLFYLLVPLLGLATFAALTVRGIQIGLEYRDVIARYQAQGVARNRIPPTAVSSPIFFGIFLATIGLIVLVLSIKLYWKLERRG